jgi:hypothetical protein
MGILSLVLFGIGLLLVAAFVVVSLLSGGARHS